MFNRSVRELRTTDNSSETICEQQGFSRTVHLSRRAFTVLELLVVIAVIGILGAVVLPALGRTRPSNHASVCLSNHQRIMAALQLYAVDNADTWVPNEADQTPCWVSGIMDFNPGSTDGTNTALLTNAAFAKLAPYARDPRIYKCPSDRSYVRQAARVRSVSMNSAVGTTPTAIVCAPLRPAGSAVSGVWLDGSYNRCQTRWRTYGKTSQMIAPTPAGLFVTIDEHPDSINDPQFLMQCAFTGASSQFVDYPASSHDGGAGVSFADGHAEIHKWTDPRTRIPERYSGSLGGGYAISPNNPDVLWLQQHTSALR